jgi:release factor glutamine methyltransferase
VFAEEEADLIVATASAAAEIEEQVRRREGGEPLEHVLGWAELGGIRVRVGPGVFVPRARSALLLAEASARAGDGAVVVDMCCGSGAIGLAVAASRRRVELHAADLDPVAVRCARENLEGVGEVHEGDLLDALPAGLRGRIDVLVANAPYVPSRELELLPREAREHEPALALDGGADGLDVHRRLIAAAPEWLAPRGHLLFEAGLDQLDAALAELERGGLEPGFAVDEELEVAVAVGSLPAERPLGRA